MGCRKGPAADQNNPAPKANPASGALIAGTENSCHSSGRPAKIAAFRARGGRTFT
jgi:hypothetical protein